MKNSYKQAMDKIHISREATERIIEKCIELNKKEAKQAMSKKKFILIAAAAVFVLGITVFAGSGIISNWNSSSKSTADFTEIKEARRYEKEVGFKPLAIKEFKNGYAFTGGNVVSNSLNDEGGASVKKFKSLDFIYAKEGDRVFISQDKYTSEMGELDGEITDTINGTEVHLSAYTNKFVPPDYTLTEEDKKAEASGELVFSYGSDKVQLSEVKSVKWVSDGVLYDITQRDGKLSADDLVDMVREIENGK